MLLVTANIYVAQHAYSYDSDDVSWQATLLTWKPFSGQTAYVGAKDNFLINAPFIFGFEHIFHATRTQLLAESIFFALLNFVLFYIAAMYFLKKANVKLNDVSFLPFIWLASFGSGFTGNFLNTNWRDYEFGLSFIFYMLAAKYFYREISPYASVKSKISAVVVLGLSALITYSDPYFFYFTLLPIAVLYVVLWQFNKVNRQKALTAVGFSILSPAIARAYTSLFARVGIIAPHGTLGITSIHNVGATISLLVTGMADLFSINFSQNFLESLGNVCLLAVIIFLIIKLRTDLSTRVRGTITPEASMRIILGFLSIFTVIAYLGIGDANVGNYRYLIMFVYAGVLLLALCVSKFRPDIKRAVVAILALTTLLNIFVTASQASDGEVAAKGANAGNYQLINAVKKLGYSKGYAGYWDGNINTYLSGDSVKFLPVTCSNQGVVTKLPLLVNGGLFNQVAPKTFYVFDTAKNSPKTCSKQQVLRQFGQPDGQVRVGGDTVLLYDYDLYAKMPQST